LNKPFKKRLSLRVSLAYVILLIVILTGAFMVFFSYVTNRDIVVRGYGEQARRIAQTIASAIDSERFAHISDTREPDDYLYHIQGLLDRTINKTDVLFIYILFPGYEDGVVTYFAAGVAEGREWPVYFGQTERVYKFPPDLFQAMNEGISTMSDIYDAGKFGILIGGFAPIIDNIGRVVGLVCVELDVGNIVVSIQRFVTTMLIFTAILVLVFFALAMLIANKIFITPIKTLTETLTSASNNNESSYKFPTSPINEMNVLFDSFSKMVQLEAAEESSKSKSRFLARMSHEIRTPITAVLGISEIELRRQKPSSDPKESFAKIHNSANMLLGIVNDILDLSRIEAGKMELLCAEYDTASMVNDIVHTHLAHLNNKDVKFCISVSEGLPRLLNGDVIRIKQIMNNLLSNAFKYTKYGTVNLSITWDHINLLISIRDTGFGMTQEQLDALRNDYSRFHERQMRQIEGTGLGMPIVYHLAHIMGGNVVLESELGKGTCVTIYIPQKTVGTELLGEEAARRLERFESGPWSAAKNFDFVPEPMPYGKVLVVDDMKTNLFVVAGMLEAYELGVELCGGGMEAIDKIKQGKVYDIIFMDHMMPDMDGIEATKIIRGMGYTHPIVAFSANTLKGHEEMFMSNGFAGFISKPIDRNRLHSFLERFVRDKSDNVAKTVRESEDLTV